MKGAIDALRLRLLPTATIGRPVPPVGSLHIQSHLLVTGDSNDRRPRHWHRHVDHLRHSRVSSLPNVINRQTNQPDDSGDSVAIGSATTQSSLSNRRCNGKQSL